MRRRLIGGLLGVALVASFAASAAAAATPAKVLASIFAAARAQRSVHYTAAAQFGDEKLQFVGDARVDEGIQTVTVTKSGQTGRFTVIVTAKAAYLRGDAFALVNYYKFSANAASNFAGRWVRYPHTDSRYPDVSGGVTLSSVLDGIELRGAPSKARDAKIDGQRVLGLKTTGKSSEGTVTNTLYARATGLPLPVKWIVHAKTQSVATSLSRWNAHVDVAAPKVSTPISIVRKSAPGLIA